MKIVQDVIYIERHLTTIKDFEGILIGNERKLFLGMTEGEKLRTLRDIEMGQIGLNGQNSQEKILLKRDGEFNIKALEMNTFSYFKRIAESLCRPTFRKLTENK